MSVDTTFAEGDTLVKSLFHNLQFYDYSLCEKVAALKSVIEIIENCEGIQAAVGLESGAAVIPDGYVRFGKKSVEFNA